MSQNATRASTTTRPDHLLDGPRQSLDVPRLVRHLQTHCLGRQRRQKVRELCLLLFGRLAKHGAADEVVLREALHDLVRDGAPIGTEPGPDGGVWWLATVEEWRAVVATAEAQVTTLQRRLMALRALRVGEPWAPRQATLWK